MAAHRPNWDEYFMTLAVIASSRSTCLRGCIGAVLVKDNRVLSTGYNGSPAGQPHCMDEGCLQDERGKGCLRTVHAEGNAIAWAARHGISLAGCTCYLSSYTPCLACANLLAQVGCARVVYRTLYRDERALRVLREAAMELVEFTGQLVNVDDALGMHDDAVRRAKAEIGCRLVKIVIAPDSFKGSLSALEVCEAIEAGLRDSLVPAPEIISIPLADGGEGTVQALVDATGGRIIRRQVTGPLGDPVEAFFGMLGDGRTAAIEMAAASGLPLVPPERRDPTVTTTRGTGELIVAAMAEGAQELLIGLGGSATNDGGMGMARALGVRFLNSGGQDLPPGGGALADLASIKVPSEARERMAGLSVKVACDVDNPLCGPRGASAIYGPQKGATPEQVHELDRALGHYASIVKRDVGADILNVPGAGAAGGLGGGLMAFLSGQLLPGVDIVTEAVGLADALEGADWCITGEGQLDQQTPYGKTPTGAAKAAAAAGVPVIALGGAVDRSARPALEDRFDVVLPISQGPGSLEEAVERGAEDLRTTARQLARLILAARGAN